MHIRFQLSPSSLDSSENNVYKTGETASGDNLSNDDLKSPAQEWKEMREEEAQNKVDSSLQSPQDANTTKHINFLDTDETDNNSVSNDDQESSAQQQWREMREEKLQTGIDPSLQSPQDANTQKHVNFLDSEEADPGTSSSE